jgi:hypothetical protein
MRGLLACAVAAAGCAKLRPETRDDREGPSPKSAEGKANDTPRFDRNLGLESMGLD